ncbi:hypothetical protein KC340_g4209 [Hortaea werneckii]|nr:hypothetical protein KC342_g3050 [Hortaea werneckii]KAI7109312.1 hypothetical protein KC339_g888 [Hortaea werneckii]KAI7233839.1 hypothetical protein KC365_g6191 [Hortaea werneckii]KAI7330443.1 hypothetical protein KC340_g4209 [Hortaea werneckii]KAI7383540.1 hypothetical protein KC328_g11229 [Hortaea werneckii]
MLQLGRQKAKCNAHSFGGQTHAQMPSRLTKDVFPAPKPVDSGAPTDHQYRENGMVLGNEDRDSAADVDAGDRGETMERLSLVILHETNRTSLAVTVIMDGDAATDVDASDLGQTMERLPLMLMLLLLPLLYDVDSIGQTTKMMRDRDTTAHFGASDLG